MNKIEKMATKDAYDWGIADMFFGEGAGTRRKLVKAVIDQRVNDIPGYEDAFVKAIQNLDQIEMAEKAIAERKKIDAAAKHGKNLRALKNGNIAGLTNGVFVVVGLGYVLHVTGYDKVVLDESKKVYKKAKTEVRYRKARWQGRNVTKIV